MTAETSRMRPAMAWRALRQLVNDPEDTPRVFEVIRALAGPSQVRGLRRFRRSETGKRILAEQIDLLDTLHDRHALAALPKGTLGRAYHDFIYGESLTADGLVEASIENDDNAYSYSDPDLRRFSERMRDQHDLWHTVTGYGRDPFGEACLLAFTYAQTRNRGVGVIVLVAAWLARSDGLVAWRALWKAFQNGRHASWLPEQDWEAMLKLPLADVRRQLALPQPWAYRQALASMQSQPA